MGNMEGWDIALLAAAGYMAITALVRMMIRQRDRLVAELSKEAAEERGHQKALRRKEAQRRLAG